MKKEAVFTGAALIALTLASGTSITGDPGVMDRLAKLEGDWIMLDENGEDTGEIASTFRISSGGSVLVEVMGPGNPDGHEMFNMYHADGERVLMTHYCAAGNQPRMEVLATDDENRLELRFESITNLPSSEADHMHQAEYLFHGEDRLTTRWWSMSGGEVSEENHVTIEMRRK